MRDDLAGDGALRAIPVGFGVREAPERGCWSVRVQGDVPADRVVFVLGEMVEGGRDRIGLDCLFML